jgi:hypothetical protein
MLSLLQVFILGVTFAAYGKCESIFITPKELDDLSNQDNPVYSLNENVKLAWETGHKGACNLFVWQVWPRGPLESYEKILGIIDVSFYAFVQSADRYSQRTRLTRAIYGIRIRL